VRFIRACHLSAGAVVVILDAITFAVIPRTLRSGPAPGAKVNRLPLVLAVYP
jgi:hypothetical protein